MTFSSGFYVRRTWARLFPRTVENRPELYVDIDEITSSVK